MRGAGGRDFVAMGHYSGDVAGGLRRRYRRRLRGGLTPVLMKGDAANPYYAAQKKEAARMADWGAPPGFKPDTTSDPPMTPEQLDRVTSNLESGALTPWQLPLKTLKRAGIRWLNHLHPWEAQLDENAPLRDPTTNDALKAYPFWYWDTKRWRTPEGADRYESDRSGRYSLPSVKGMTEKEADEYIATHATGPDNDAFSNFGVALSEAVPDLVSRIPGFESAGKVIKGITTGVNALSNMGGSAHLLGRTRQLFGRTRRPPTEQEARALARMAEARGSGLWDTISNVAIKHVLPRAVDAAVKHADKWGR